MVQSQKDTARLSSRAMKEPSLFSKNRPRRPRLKIRANPFSQDLFEYELHSWLAMRVRCPLLSDWNFQIQEYGWTNENGNYLVISVATFDAAIINFLNIANICFISVDDNSMIIRSFLFFLPPI